MNCTLLIFNAAFEVADPSQNHMILAGVGLAPQRDAERYNTASHRAAQSPGLQLTMLA